MSLIEKAARWLFAAFALDRALKAFAIWAFFRRPAPSAPARWPTITLLQPFTRGVRNLEGTLQARLALHYPAFLQHLWIVDRDDQTTRLRCEQLRDEHSDANAQIIVVSPDLGAIASKARKLCEALPVATGEVLWFLDDDVTLPRDGLTVGVPYLLQPGVGSIFGLARYTNWRNLPSGAMSVFVNANALLSYVPLTFLTEPYTITGHSYALRRDVFEALGGSAAVQGRADDDHELARRVQRQGLRNVQTPLIYSVDNDLPTLQTYFAQMRRWFILPRRLMLPHLSSRNLAVTGLSSIANVIPPLLLVLAVLHRSRRTMGFLSGTWLITLALYLGLERRYTRDRTALARLPLVLLDTILAPLLIVAHLLGGETILWRGQRLHVQSDGTLDLVED